MFECAVKSSALLLLVAAISGAATAPPRVFLEVHPSSIQTTGRVHIVESGKNLQAALDDARPGDELVLTAGERYVGNFVLPKKQGAGWITLRSSAMDRLPGDGTRVRPAHAASMPKLIAPNNQPALAAATGAGFYRVVGVEIAPAEDVTYHYGLVGLGGEHTNATQIPHDFIFDRVYVHGHSRTALKRGITLNSATTVIANSYIADSHVAGQDAQAVGGWNGPGPYKLINNYLEGSGENLMFGGADARVPDLVPSDIEIRGNHFYKPLTWRKEEPTFAGTAWTVKNLLELKSARRVWIEGNVLENCWVHGQVGFAVLLTPRNQDGRAPWGVVEDVTFINNIVRHCSSGISVLAEDDNHPSQLTQRVLFRNNLFEDINPTRFGGDGRMLQILAAKRPIVDLVLERNTLIHGGRGNTFICVESKDKVVQQFAYRSNLVTCGQYGFHGSRGMGCKGLQAYCDDFDFSGNVIIGTADAKNWPEGNRVVESVDAVGFENAATGNFHLTRESPFSGPDVPGADIDALSKATSGAVSGVWK